MKNAQFSRTRYRHLGSSWHRLAAFEGSGFHGLRRWRSGDLKNGATGQIGGRVAIRLADAGCGSGCSYPSSRARPRWRVRMSWWPEVTLTASVPPRLEGVSAGVGRSLTQHFMFIDPAPESGVRHIVYTSFMGTRLQRRSRSPQP